MYVLGGKKGYIIEQHVYVAVCYKVYITYNNIHWTKITCWSLDTLWVKKEKDAHKAQQ